MRKEEGRRDEGAMMKEKWRKEEEREVRRREEDIRRRALKGKRKKGEGGRKAFRLWGIKLSGKKYYEELTYFLCPFCITIFMNEIKSHPNHLKQAGSKMMFEHRYESNNSILNMPPLNELAEEIKEQERQKLFRYLQEIKLKFNDNLVYKSNDFQELNKKKYESNTNKKIEKKKNN